MRPNLSRGSLSSTTGTPKGASYASTTVERLNPFEEEAAAIVASPPPRPPSPVRFERMHNLGPVDPRKYSAVTGLRNIGSFAVQGEAGKGAYGTVQKARELDAQGQPFGVGRVVQTNALLTATDACVRVR